MLHVPARWHFPEPKETQWLEEAGATRELGKRAGPLTGGVDLEAQVLGFCGAHGWL